MTMDDILALLGIGGPGQAPGSQGVLGQGLQQQRQAMDAMEGGGATPPAGSPTEFPGTLGDMAQPVDTVGTNGVRARFQELPASRWTPQEHALAAQMGQHPHQGILEQLAALIGIHGMQSQAQQPSPVAGMPGQQQGQTNP